MARIKPRHIGLAVLLPLLSGCGGGLIATVGPDYPMPIPPTANRWQAPPPVATLPHGGNPAALQRWWGRFDDPVLSRFLAAAQRESASVAEARSRIVQARAGLTGAEAAGLPALDGKLDASRSSFSFGGPAFIRNQYQIGLQANWEVDLFGGVARQREAAQRQLESRTASWHDARVAVAVEVADAYLGYRQCEVLVKIAQADALSRQESARLTGIARQAGLRAPADAALALASAADGQDSLLRQQGQCERSIKGLVALTGLSEAEVRHGLGAAPERVARLPTPPPFRLAALPAQVLMQRPDVAAAERDVAEASANIGVEQAKRFPRLSLSGNITPSLQNINGAALALAETWSFGPTLTLPLFDAGKRAADVEAAKARYEAAMARFRSTVRTAVKEIEEALVRLRVAEERLPQAHAAAQGYRTNFQATEQLYRAGFGNLIDA
ncbi:MAG: efflux transporter outer membrane subunit, partial [Methylococcaceae bacterium]|nr:efflux transporter outer membrane subunit [Methylococcaceae bacterium]